MPCNGEWRIHRFGDRPTSSLTLDSSMIRLASAAFLAVISSGALCAQDAPFTVSDDPAVISAAQSITARDFLWRIGVIAHDSMGGRDTPSAGLDATAAWIASEFETFGLRPGGDDGSYLQQYAIQTIRADLRSSAVQVEGGQDLRFGRDVLPSGRGLVEGDFTGPVILVSGLEGDLDSYAETIHGSHVVYAAPEGSDRRAFSLLRRFRTMGALSVTTLADVTDDAWTRARTDNSERSLVRVGFGGESTPFFTFRAQVMRSILEAHGVTMPLPGNELVLLEVPDMVLTYSPRIEVLESRNAPNVVGILEGSDPVLKDEYLVYSAHMDHIGIGNADESGDSIFNGADDDASGTTGIIELAEAFSGMEIAPRRSIIFLLVSGEEKGLWGSAFFAMNSGVGIENIVANVNADMIGRNWSDTIVVIGKEQSDLGGMLNRVNEAHPELNMTAIDDLWPEERFYFRSDHYNFARRGVPILFFFNGVHEDYHRRGDEVHKIDTDKATRITRLMFYLGWEVTNRDERPQWDPESFRQIVENAS